MAMSPVALCSRSRPAAAHYPTCRGSSWAKARGEQTGARQRFHQAFTAIAGLRAVWNDLHRDRRRLRRAGSRFSLMQHPLDHSVALFLWPCLSPCLGLFDCNSPVLADPAELHSARSVRNFHWRGLRAYSRGGHECVTPPLVAALTYREDGGLARGALALFALGISWESLWHGRRQAG